MVLVLLMSIEALPCSWNRLPAYVKNVRTLVLRYYLVVFENVGLCVHFILFFALFLNFKFLGMRNFERI